MHFNGFFNRSKYYSVLYFLRLKMSFDSHLDIQFSPSQWSKKSKGNQRSEEHIKCIENCSQIVKQIIPCELDLPYGSGKREVIDIYGTDLSEDSPVFIHFHGGYWQEPIVRHNNNSFIAKHLYYNKIKSFFVGYELCPDVTLDELSQNIENALKMCLNQLRNKTRRIHLSGHSAGAQIVANLFKKFIPNLPEEDQILFKTAFLIAGIYDLMPLLETSYNNLLKLDKDTALSASPLHQKLFANKCEFIIVTAEHDCPKFLEQGEEMYKHLVSLGIKADLVSLNNMDHFDVIENLDNKDDELMKLIVHYCNKD